MSNIQTGHFPTTNSVGYVWVFTWYCCKLWSYLYAMAFCICQCWSLKGLHRIYFSMQIRCLDLMKLQQRSTKKKISASDSDGRPFWNMQTR